MNLAFSREQISSDNVIMIPDSDSEEYWDDPESVSSEQIREDYYRTLHIELFQFQWKPMKFKFTVWYRPSKLLMWPISTRQVNLSDLQQRALQLESAPYTTMVLAGSRKKSSGDRVISISDSAFVQEHRGRSYHHSDEEEVEESEVTMYQPRWCICRMVRVSVRRRKVVVPVMSASRVRGQIVCD